MAGSYHPSIFMIKVGSEPHGEHEAIREVFFVRQSPKNNEEDPYAKLTL